MNEYADRLRRLAASLREKGMNGCLIAHNVNLYYFTGSMQTGYLFVDNQGRAIFYVRRSERRAQAEAQAEVKPLGSFRDFGRTLANDFPGALVRAAAPRIGAEFDVLPVQLYRRLESLLPGAEWEDVSPSVRRLRMIKSESEIAAIRRAAVLVDQAFEDGLCKLAVGMREIDFLAGIEHALRRGGHMGLMRMRGFNRELVTGMVVSGEAAAMPTSFDGPAGGEGLGPAFPQSAGLREIRPGEPILVDIGCCVDGYVIDQTRTVVIGEPSGPCLNAYAAAERILRMTEDRLRPGASCAELYRRSREEAERAGLLAHYMGYGSDQAAFLGHGIGLEIDEWPVLSAGSEESLAPGMVVAVEPKFVFPGVGVVGVEDSYLITKDGNERLTRSRQGLVIVEP